MRAFKFEDDYNTNNQNSLTMPIIPITFANTNSKMHKKPNKDKEIYNKESREEKIQNLATLIYREFTEKGSLSEEFLRSIS